MTPVGLGIRSTTFVKTAVAQWEKFQAAMFALVNSSIIMCASMGLQLAHRWKWLKVDITEMSIK